MHRGMDWDNLQVFLTIARTGRVSAAARRLGVEHTTVSRRLEVLEKELGVPLFYRTTTGYLLTPHGKNVVASAETMERAAIAVAGRAREGSGAIAGRVRLALAPEFASHWLAPELPAFRAKHPQIELQILVGTRERDLTRGEAELSIQSPRPRQQGLVAVRIAHTTRRCTRRSVDRRVGGSGSLAWRLCGIFRCSFTRHRIRCCSRRSGSSRFFPPPPSGSRPTARMRCLPRPVRGPASPSFPASSRARTSDLIAVSENVADHDVWLITHPEFRRDPKIRATADFLKRVAAGPQGLSWSSCIPAGRYSFLTPQGISIRGRTGRNTLRDSWFTIR